MENIINRAIDGGYTHVIHERSDGIKIYSYDQGMHKIVLDPLFWQLLGKACGWQTHGRHETKGNNLRCFRCGAPWNKEGDCEKNEVLGWKIIALRFYGINLTEDWNAAVKYLSDLIADK